MGLQTATAAILQFNPITRQSERRRRADARARREERAADLRQLRTEAKTLGLTAKAFEADADLDAHYEAVLELEIAYGIQPSDPRAAEGRRALLGIISQYFSDGHDAGLEDGKNDGSRNVRHASSR